MTKSQTLPPDITVTRADVLALPMTGSPTPDDGRAWTLTRRPEGELRWIERWGDEVGQWRFLTHLEAAAAERVFFWQTALASDAALTDIGNDPAPTTPPVVVQGDLLATIRNVLAEETAKAIRHVAVGAKA